ncbi:polysaccharide deacetylase family protein [Paenibacillus sp. FSL H7-0357]|uniref:polysaccharide deacetylase family protein n=1 Tax=Paenibacillus sp. FSL H7-0357 TaxID=1536774 RepID=UPI000690B19E|nr:polysaccharide deacetylase family protein [Paenibacillus sp. FSL H7-0357]
MPNKIHNSNERFLIVTADDFGMCHSMNEAIMNLYQADAINSSMIMMPGPWAKEAAEYAKNHHNVNVGIHLTLTSSLPAYKWGPVTRSSRIQSLITAEGYFWEHAAHVEERATAEAIRTEIRSQIEMALTLGIEPTHLDSHEGSLLGLSRGRDFLEIVFDLCQEYRLPFKLPVNIVNQSFLDLEMRELMTERIESARKRGILLIDDLINLPYHLEQGEDYDIAKVKMMEAIKGVGGGITEVVIHPALNTYEMRAITPHWKKREIEYLLFMDEDIHRLLQTEKIQLTSWKDIRDRQRQASGGDTTGNPDYKGCRS